MQASEPIATIETVSVPIPLGLRGLSGAVAAMGNLTVTVDGVPDAARLSAGQFLGDGTWSVHPGELDDLTIHPSPGYNRNCRLSVRIRKIDKDMGDAFSIGAVYIEIDAEAGHATITGADGAVSLKRKSDGGGDPPAANMAPVRPRPSAPDARQKAPVKADPPRGQSAKPSSPLTERAPLALPGKQTPKSAAGTQRPTATPAPKRLAAEKSGPSPIDLGVGPPAAPDEASARQDQDPNIVRVRVSSGMRIGKFGKTGRPEEVVSVRGRSGRGAGPRPSMVVFRAGSAALENR